MTLPCFSLRVFILQAYGTYGDGHFDRAGERIPIEGGPSWITSDHFLIEAKTERPQTREMMNGPMLQAILEERFQVKVHYKTTEVPVYELVVAKGGPKLHAFDGSCTPVDYTKTPVIPAPKEKTDECRNVLRGTPSHMTRYLRGTSIDNFVLGSLGRGTLDRPVINKTGIEGLFDIKLEFARPDSEAPDAPTIFDALQQQLGLKLVPAKGPSKFLVIDHAERPSEN